MRSTVLHTIHTRDTDAEWFQTKLHNTQVRWDGGARGMARRLSNSRQSPAGNHDRSNAVHTGHARELGAALAEDPDATINQSLKTVTLCLHREIQIHLQATSIT